MIRLTVQKSVGRDGKQAFEPLGHVSSDALPSVGQGFVLNNVPYRIIQIDWRCHEPRLGDNPIAEPWVTLMEWERTI